MAKKYGLKYGIAIALGAIGWILAFAARRILVGWWYLPAIALLCSVLLIGPMAKFWQGFTKSKNPFLNSSIAIIIGCGILSGLFIGLNFVNQPVSTPQKVACPYYSYHAEVLMSDSCCYVVPVTLQYYHRSKPGDSIYVRLHRGLLGVKYITR